MAIAFVKNLFAGTAKGTGTSLVLSGSAVVSAGNTIFVAFGSSSGGEPFTITDNLGNTYTVVSSKLTANLGTHLYRADITNPGTLTTITIDQPPGFNVYAAIAVEFSGVGPLRTAAVASGASGAAHNAYPGGTLTANATYVAGDLWIGAWAQKSVNTFASDTGGTNLAAIEPTPEQKTTGGAASTNVNVGLLYYTSPSGETLKTLAGRFSASAEGTAVGAAIAQRVAGPTFNDTPTGSIVFTGTRTESYGRAFNDAPAAALALGGSVIESQVVRKTYNDAPTGALVFTGSAVESFGKSFTDARSGTLALSGTRTEKMARADAPSGRAAFSGSVVESSFTRIVYTDAPIGSISIGGTRVESIIYRPSGRIPVSGSIAAESNRRAESITGSIRSYGWSAEPVPASLPRPVGVPGALAASPPTVVNPTILKPDTGSGYEPGDVLICFAAGSGNSSLNMTTAPPPPDWVLGKPPPTGSPAPLYLLAKIAASRNEPPPTLTFNTQAGSPGSAGTPVIARIVAFRNLDTRDLANIADVVGLYKQQTLVGASTGGEAIITQYDSDLVLTLTRRDIGSVVNRVNAPAGFSLLSWDLLDSGQRSTFAWAYQIKKPAGLVSAPVFAVNTPDGGSYQTNGVAVALKAVAVEGHISTPVGTLSLTGSRVERKIYTDKPSGSIAVAGAVTAESHVQRPKPTGTLKLSGTVQEYWSHIGTVTGSISLVGTTKTVRRYVEAVSGTLSVNGAAEDFYRINYFDKCAGVLRLAGIASHRLVFSDAPGGPLRLAGRASDFIEIDEAIFYDDFPAGLVVLNGRLVFVSEDVQPGRGGRIVGALGTGRVVRHLEPGRVVGNLTGRVT